LEELTFERGRIVGYQAKTNTKNSDSPFNYVNLALTVEMNKEAAEALGCYDQVYAEDGEPMRNFAGHQLKLKIRDVRFSFAPENGATLTADAEKVTGFSIYPVEDEVEGLEMAILARFNEGLNKIHEFYNKQTSSPLMIQLSPLQQDLPLNAEDDTTDDEEDQAALPFDLGDDQDDEEDLIGEESDIESTSSKPKRGSTKKTTTKKTAAPKKVVAKKPVKAKATKKAAAGKK
jgi:hypothetical protein